MAKDKKKNDWDSGITVAPMNGDELPKYRRLAYLNREKRPSKEERLKHKQAYTKKERRAIIRAGFLAMLPQLIIILVAFGIVFGIIYLWLS
ncbi:MAG: hypothetical protein NC037_06745 [Bacteroides sp.]|nr:hypothetical protein [Bacillota bacterium]MCM1394449.1 hypothetical protein [[Eubacterium] siraeum]MCM1456203.1 hypothetical protein [Bacteroides sp.]